MKITAMLDEDMIQFNLCPESEHEKKFMAMLSDYTGTVSVHCGVNVAECRGGFLRDFGESASVTAITIRKPVKLPEEAGKG